MEVMNQELERVKTEGQEQAKQDVMYLLSSYFDSLSVVVRLGNRSLG
jgi:hypothetical protein